MEIKVLSAREITEALNSFDKEEYMDLVNMYESIRPTVEDKENISMFIEKKEAKSIAKYLESKTRYILEDAQQSQQGTNSRKIIRDWQDKLVGYVDTMANGDKILRDWTGLIKGFYKVDANMTLDAQRHPRMKGDALMFLLGD